MTILIEIEKDWVRIAGQTVYRPENIVPGDWLSLFDRLNADPVDAEDYESRIAELEEEVSDLEKENTDLTEENHELREENDSLENEVENLENEIERIKELEGLDY